MPELGTAFHPPRVIREAAIARVAVQFSQLEEVLIPGTSAARPEQLLLDEPPDARCRAVAEVLGRLGDRERPRPMRRARHRRTANAFGCVRGMAHARVPSRQLATARRS